MKYFLLAIVMIAGLSACKKQNEKIAENDERTIQDYIADWGLNATPTGSGLYVVIDNPGTGASCNSTSTVKVAYKGYFTNGEEFDKSTSGITFGLDQVIAGWTEGIPYFKEGGNGKLLIPSALAYGTKGSGPIPSNTVIIFDIELIDVL